MKNILPKIEREMKDPILKIYPPHQYIRFSSAPSTHKTRLSSSTDFDRNIPTPLSHTLHLIFRHYFSIGSTIFLQYSRNCKLAPRNTIQTIASEPITMFATSSHYKYPISLRRNIKNININIYRFKATNKKYENHRGAAPLP